MICVDAQTLVGPDGNGLAEARIFDAEGLAGRSTQCLPIGCAIERASASAVEWRVRSKGGGCIMAKPEPLTLEQELAKLEEECRKVTLQSRTHGRFARRSRL
jgi:hypothetical protein